MISFLEESNRVAKAFNAVAAGEALMIRVGAGHGRAVDGRLAVP
jgi:hypothetical protein